MAQRWLEPKPGQNENLRIVLAKLPPQELPKPAVREEPEVTAQDLSGEPPEPKQPRSAQGGKLLAGAVFGMNFDPDFHGIVPFLGFRGNAYTGDGRGATSVEGKVGKALRFSNGSTLTVKGKFPSGRQPRTISVWLKPTEGKEDQGYALVCGDPQAGKEIFAIQIIRGNWFFTPLGGLAPVDTHVAADAAWHHHCLVYDGKYLLYTIDGAPAMPVPLDLNTSAGVLCLGGLFANRVSFSGDIDELVVYDRALSPMEIQQLYQMGEDGLSVLAAGRKAKAAKR
jgi:hypothetical protein